MDFRLLDEYLVTFSFILRIELAVGAEVFNTSLKKDGNFPLIMYTYKQDKNRL